MLSPCCRKHYLLRACAASFVGFLIGYLLMAVAPNIWLLLPATVPCPEPWLEPIECGHHIAYFVGNLWHL